MSIFSNDSDLSLRDELNALRQEIASLGRSLSKQGARTASHTRENASELYADIADAIRSALPAVRAPARRVQRAVQDHPDRAIALAGLTLLAVAAAVVFNSRR